MNDEPKEIPSKEDQAILEGWRKGVPDVAAQKRRRNELFKNCQTTIFETELDDDQLRAQSKTLPKRLQQHLTLAGILRPETPKARVTPVAPPEKRTLVGTLLYGVALVLVIWPTKALIGLLKLCRREAKPVKKPDSLLDSLNQLTNAQEAKERREITAEEWEDPNRNKFEMLEMQAEKAPPVIEPSVRAYHEQVVSKMAGEITALQQENEDLKKKLAKSDPSKETV